MLDDLFGMHRRRDSSLEASFYEFQLYHKVNLIRLFEKICKLQFLCFVEASGFNE